MKNTLLSFILLLPLFSFAQFEDVHFEPVDGGSYGISFCSKNDVKFDGIRYFIDIDSVAFDISKGEMFGVKKSIDEKTIWIIFANDFLEEIPKTDSSPCLKCPISYDKKVFILTR